MGLNVDAGAPVTARIESILSAVKRIKLGQSLTVKTVSETIRSYGSSIQRDTFWTVVHETHAVVAQDQRGFPREATPFA